MDKDDVTGSLGFSLGGMPSPGAADPDVNLRDVADGPGLNQFNHSSVVVTSVNLGSHLSCDPGLECRFADNSCLPDIMCQRFLAVDVFTKLKGW